MYLGTSDNALQTAQNLRDEELQRAYRRTRVATRNARIKSCSTTSRMFRITPLMPRSGQTLAVGDETPGEVLQGT